MQFSCFSSSPDRPQYLSLTHTHTKLQTQLQIHQSELLVFSPNCAVSMSFTLSMVGKSCRKSTRIFHVEIPRFSFLLLLLLWQLVPQPLIKPLSALWAHHNSLLFLGLFQHTIQSHAFENRDHITCSTPCHAIPISLRGNDWQGSVCLHGPPASPAEIQPRWKSPGTLPP